MLLVRAEQHVSQQRAALLAHGHLLVDHGWTVGAVHQDLRGEKGTEQLEGKSVIPSSSLVSRRKKPGGGGGITSLIKRTPHKIHVKRIMAAGLKKLALAKSH